MQLSAFELIGVLCFVSLLLLGFGYLLATHVHAIAKKLTALDLPPPPPPPVV